MKPIRFFALISFVLLLIGGTSCTSTVTEEKPLNLEPKVAQMKAICELAVMECYYHNVAKYFEEDAEQFIFWKKDKNFWIEYGGIVKLGIDVSLLDIQVNNTQVTISIPKAKVLSCTVDEATLSKDSFIVAKDSADISAKDEINAFSYAQEKLKELAKNDTTLLANAQQRAQSLLEDYVNNIGNATGKTYTINWNYINEENSMSVKEISK